MLIISCSYLQKNVKDGFGVLKGVDNHGGLFMGVEYIPLHSRLVHSFHPVISCEFPHYAFCYASKPNVVLFHSHLYGSKISHLYSTGLSFQRVFTQGKSRLACCLLNAYKAKILLRLRLLRWMTPFVSIVSRYVELFCSHLCKHKLKAINIVMGVKHPPLHSRTYHFYSSSKYLWTEPLKKNCSFANLSCYPCMSINKSARRTASLPPFYKKRDAIKKIMLIICLFCFGCQTVPTKTIGQVRPAEFKEWHIIRYRNLIPIEVEIELGKER